MSLAFYKKEIVEFIQNNYEDFEDNKQEDDDEKWKGLKYIYIFF